MKQILLGVLFMVCAKAYAQPVNTSQKIAASKKAAGDYFLIGRKEADSFSTACYSRYTKALDSVQKIIEQNKKQPIVTTDLKEIWQAGYNTANANTPAAAKLVTAICVLPDSFVFEKIAATNLLTFVPAHNTGCCAIPDGWKFTDSIYNDVSSLVWAALSTNTVFQNFSNYQRGQGTQGTLYHAIEVGLTDAGYYPHTKNGYSKQKPLDPKEVIEQHIKPEPAKGKAFYYKYKWLIAGGTGLLALIGLIMYRRKK